VHAVGVLPAEGDEEDKGEDLEGDPYEYDVVSEGWVFVLLGEGGG
jgi:hypothetical protein